MKKLTVSFCLMTALVFGSVGAGWSADLDRGLAAYKRGDFATALREWAPLAQNGDARLQALLGSMYSTGKGVPRNYETAIKWYTLAANKGIAMAQNNLGLMFDSGQGVTKNHKTAVEWYQLAAEQGYSIIPDGLFGPGTAKAIQAFKKQKNIAGNNVPDAFMLGAMLGN